MDHDELMELILDHYKNPRHAGAIDNARVVQKGGNPGCGDVVTIYIDADDDGIVRGLGFEGEGCMVSQAGTSIILEKAEGKTLSEIEGMPHSIVTGILGKRLVATRPGCANLGFNTLKLAAMKLRAGNPDTLKDEDAGGD